MITGVQKNFMPLEICHMTCCKEQTEVLRRKATSGSEWLGGKKGAIAIFSGEYERIYI